MRKRCEPLAEARTSDAFFSLPVAAAPTNDPPTQELNLNNFLARGRSEFGERHCKCPLDPDRKIGEVQELVGVGAHQAGEIAHTRLAAPSGPQREQIGEELPHA